MFLTNTVGVGEKGEEGGSIAVQQLIDSVKRSLRRKGLESCEVMVRVYANLVGLSKFLWKNGPCGAEKRSLSYFVAGFNSSYGLADFVDAGELEKMPTSSSKLSSTSTPIMPSASILTLPPDMTWATSQTLLPIGFEKLGMNIERL
ncbi:Hypothetical protein NCS54_01484000 [Fusarium falciforme]|uniref:Hypothetical protein n=1 Tax=Fusarium falciforme TaxID=195108 RepID=UPI00230149AB|nr:Hypothetical protein NCS54_01484000 [Fusarium falciforme]WAO97129.1 Hypothetical protein NCS54_01484000 [Fusarium falciforme]